MKQEFIWDARDLQVSELVDEVKKTHEVPYSDYVFGRLENDLVHGWVPVDDRIARQDAIKFFMENRDAMDAVLAIDELPEASNLNLNLNIDMAPAEIESLKTNIGAAFERLEVYKTIGDTFESFSHLEVPDLLKDAFENLSTVVKGNDLENLIAVKDHNFMAEATLSAKFDKHYGYQTVSGILATGPLGAAIVYSEPLALFAYLGSAVLGVMTAVSAEESNGKDMKVESVDDKIKMSYFDSKNCSYLSEEFELDPEEGIGMLNKLKSDNNKYGERVKFRRGKWDLSFRYDPANSNYIKLEQELSRDDPHWLDSIKERKGFPKDIQVRLEDSVEENRKNNKYLLDKTGVHLADSLGLTKLHGKDINEKLTQSQEISHSIKDAVYYATMAKWGGEILEKKKDLLTWPKFGFDNTFLRGQVHPQLITKQGWGVPNNYDERDGSLHVTKGPMGNGKSSHKLGIGMQHAMAYTGLFNTASLANYAERDNVLVITSRPGSIGDERSRMMEDAENGRKLIERITNNSLVVLDDTYIGAPANEAEQALIDLIDAARSTGSQVLVATHFKGVEEHAKNSIGAANYHVMLDDGGNPTYKVASGVNTFSNMDKILSTAGADRDSLAQLLLNKGLAR